MAKQNRNRPEQPEIPETSEQTKRSSPPPDPPLLSRAGGDLGLENLLNDLDMTAADIQDYWRNW